MALIALTRSASRTIGDCALTFRQRESIDYQLALRQHEAYVQCLKILGCHSIELPAEDDLPDAVFVEDTAVVLDEVAIITSPSRDSRRPEVTSVAQALAPYRPLRFISGSARLEGGDVIRVGKSIYVGMSQRTNREGVEQLAIFLRPYGYVVTAVDVAECLHLKTACTYVGRNTILANRNWVDATAFAGMDVIDVAPGEPEAGNGLLVDTSVLLSSSFPETLNALQSAGFAVGTVAVSELEKAEAGVTCCSILFQSDVEA